MVHEVSEKVIPAAATAPPGGDGSRSLDLVRAASRSSEIVSAERRSVTNTNNATKHGYYGKEKRLTTELVEALVGKILRERRDAELCPEWRENSHAFVDYVIAHHGARQHRNQKLRRQDESKPWAPGNVAGWEYQRPPLRGVRAALLKDDTGRLLDCACDHRAQLSCSRSTRPCNWAVAAREAAPWAADPAGAE